MHNRALDITSAIFLFMLTGFTIYHLPQAWREEQAFNECVLRQGIARMQGQHVHKHEIARVQ